MNRKYLRNCLLGLLAGIMLLACGAPAATPVAVGAPPITVAGHEIDLQALWDKVDAYYKKGINTYETPLRKMFNEYLQADTLFRSGLKDMMAIYSTCFANVAQAESQIADAALSNMDDAQLALLVSNNLTGDGAATECASMTPKIMDYATTHRADAVQKRLAASALAIDYQVYIEGDSIEFDVMNDLMQTYGDSRLVYQALADHGVPGVTDWVWLPTRNLSIPHTDESICKGFTSGAFLESLPTATKLKYKGHETALADYYEATWLAPEFNGGVNGVCTMYRGAAIWYIQRLGQIVSSGTNTTNSTGVDDQVIQFPTIAP